MFVVIFTLVTRRREGAIENRRLNYTLNVRREQKHRTNHKDTINTTTRHPARRPHSRYDKGSYDPASSFSFSFPFLDDGGAASVRFGELAIATELNAGVDTSRLPLLFWVPSPGLKPAFWWKLVLLPSDENDCA